MSDLYLLASILSQKQFPWKQLLIPNPQLVGAIATPAPQAIQPKCDPSGMKGIIPDQTLALPEFSQLQTARKPTAPTPCASAPQPTILPEETALTSTGDRAVPLDTLEFSPSLFPQQPQPSVSNDPRPTSGSQLYHQRVAALQAGRTYTRLPVNSFWSQWANATEPPTYEQWIDLLAREADAMARGQGTNRLTVLVGDSLSLWFPVEQLPTDRFWLNQGISGDTTGGILRRLSAFADTHPDTIYVMAGINDLRRGASDEEVLHNMRQIIQQLREAHPQAQIYVHSILPTRFAAIPSSRIDPLNQQLAAIAAEEGGTYLNLTHYFADQDGVLRRELTTDGIHLSRQGYAVWDWALRSLTAA